MHGYVYTGLFFYKNMRNPVEDMFLKGNGVIKIVLGGIKCPRIQ